MLKSLRTSETGMNIQMRRTEVLANNLANANATGFKQMLTQVLEKGADQAAPAAGSEPVGVSGNAGLGFRCQLDMSQGQLRQTGNDTDVAIRGEGLFKVRHDGQEVYTRDGAFTLDRNRRLATMSGDLVLGAGGPIEIPDGAMNIAPDGMISVDGAEIGRLAIVAFDDPAQLTPVGSGLMKAPEGVAARTLSAGETEVVQGMLEGSNVSPIDTLVAMIAAQRAFEIESKVVQASDETLDKSINELSKQA